MGELAFSLSTFLGDAKAVAVCFGLAVSTLVAIFSVSKEMQVTTRRLLYALACAGFSIGVYATWLQSKGEHKAENDLKAIKKTAEETGVNLDSLVVLNKVSPSTRFHIRLSTNPTIETACKNLADVVASLPDAAKTGYVRIVKTTDDPKVKEPFVLIFGNNLTLASAEVFQRLAIDHALGGGNPLIRRDTPEGLKSPETCTPRRATKAQ